MPGDDGFSAVLGVVAGIATVLSLLWVVMFGSRNIREARTDSKLARQRRKEPIQNIANADLQFISNLPAADRLVGRRKDVLAITNLLTRGNTSAVLIKGSAGIGKTALAFHVAHHFLIETANGQDRTFDGIFQMSAKAAPLSAELFADTLGRFLGFPAISGMEEISQKGEQLHRLLVGLRLLIVLDNLETITDERVINLIFSLPPTCRLLLTSRAGLSHERPVHVINLQPLAGGGAEELLQNELHRLNLGPITSYNSDEIHKLLQLAGGSPLGIKWAIGRLGQGLTLDTVVSRLISADADLFESTFADNWAELSDEARHALMAVSMLGTSVDSSVILRAAQLNSATRAEDAIASLVTVSLFEPVRQESPVRTLRYGLHPLARAFAAKKLKEYPESEALVQFPLIESLLSFIGERQNLELGKDEYDRIEAEVPNVAQCFYWLAESSRIAPDDRKLDLLVSLANSINVFLWSRGYWGERAAICSLAAEVAEKAVRHLDAGRNSAFVGIVRFWQGNTSMARDWARKSATLMAGGTDLDLALSRRLSALIRHREGDTSGAVTQMLEVLDVVRSSDEQLQEVREKIRVFADWVCPGEYGYKTGEVALTQEIGIMYADRDRRDEAVYWLNKSRLLAEYIGDIEGAAIAISHTGRALAETHPEDAIRNFRIALDMAKRVGRKSTEGRCRLGLSQTLLRLGNRDESFREATIALDLFRRLGMKSEASASERMLTESGRSGQSWFRRVLFGR